MPEVSTFKDLSITFKKHPVTDDLVTVKDKSAIAQSISNLLMTRKGERPFQPQIGSRVRKLLFEQWDVFAADSIRTEIFNTMERLEPRIEVTEVKVDDAPDENAVEIQVDNFQSVSDLNDWFSTGAFNRNPVGITFEFEDLIERHKSGESEQSLLRPREGDAATMLSENHKN